MNNLNHYAWAKSQEALSQTNAIVNLHRLSIPALCSTNNSNNAYQLAQASSATAPKYYAPLQAPMLPLRSPPKMPQICIEPVSKSEPRNPFAKISSSKSYPRSSISISQVDSITPLSASKETVPPITAAKKKKSRVAPAPVLITIEPSLTDKQQTTRQQHMFTPKKAVSSSPGKRKRGSLYSFAAVSYTHLTLPTNREV
eukprot:TRINITY_DN5309_c0_g2_i2.p1 TRINITY_DN5309_c0_g2~~TRINITY_DN5309_c0_g2_i2.p1  ORF type:complete len:219 (+),score=20.23 TRINITY_DN5309_c0_g2_i2:62-658(+)